MATLNFPDAPDTGDEYYDSNSGFNYEWNGTVWITKDLATVNNTREIDDISSGFDGSDTTFTLQIKGVNIVPHKVEQLVISVGGVMQNPGDDYTVSGSTLTFTSAPSSGLSFTGTFLGVAASLNTITAGSVSPSSLTTTSNYIVGSIKVSGASTIGNFVLTGLTTIADPDVTNFNSSGVGTVSNVILTGDNSGLGATVGAAVGVVTYYGDASNMTGVGLTIFPLSYDPGITSTSIGLNSDIVTTWNYPIQAGSGTITIRTGSGSGTIVDQFVVGSSSSITISGRSLTLNPASSLAATTEHFVVYPAGAIKSSSGQKENNQLVTSFTTGEAVYNLWTWGVNTVGRLGHNQDNWPTHNYSSPTQVAGSYKKVYTTASSNSKYFMFSKNEGDLWGVGQNYGGALGLNSSGATSYSSPTQVGTDTTWNHVVSGSDMTISTKTDGSLWTMGTNAYGGQGLNNQGGGGSNEYSSPTQIGTDTNWSNTLANDQGASYAAKTDGTLWAWGNNQQYGALGLNEFGPAANKSSPTQVGTDTTWNNNKMTADGGAVGAIKTDGTLWVWGRQYGGTLGLNEGTADNNNSRSSPTQLPGTTWASVSTGNRTSIGTKTDGTLWSWGYNSRGQLGLNDIVQYSSPTQVGTNTDWSQVQNNVRSGYTSAALKTDGTLWVMGQNTTGELGLNNVVQLSSPTQIPGTTWNSFDLSSWNGAIAALKS